MGRLYDWVGRNRKALGWAAGGTAAAVATHLGFDTNAFDGRSLYSITDSWIRFVPYLTTALSYGRAIEITREGGLGRPLTTGERIDAYALGALAASGLWEGTENLSSFGWFYEPTHDIFGEYVKRDFPGKGSASFGDAAATAILTTGTAYLKDRISNFMEGQKKLGVNGNSEQPE